MNPTKLAQINQDKATKELASVQHLEKLAHVDNVADTVLSSTQSLIKYLDGNVTKTELVNQLDTISTPDVKYVVEALEVLDATLKTHENVDLSGVTALMQELVSQAQAIPKELPTIPEQQFVDYSDQFKSMVEAIEAVEQVVKAQKLVAEAPIVNVPETNVNVEAPDLAPLQTSIKAVVKAVEKIVIPEFKTDNKAVEKLLKDANKTLQKLLEKPVSGGGSGSSSWPAINPTTGHPAPLNLDADGNLRVSGGTGGGGGGGLSTNDGTFATETGNLAALAAAQVDGNQVTKLHANGFTVDNANPLPIKGNFTDANGATYTTANPLPVAVGDLTVQQLNVSFPAGVVSTLNTTNTPLAANESFIGQWEEVTKYSSISAAITTDQASATNGAIVEFSADGVDVIKQTAVTIPANTGLAFHFPPDARYVRIQYWNGAVAQTTLEAQVIFHYQTPGEVITPLGTQSTDLFAATTTASHLKARHSTGAWFPLEYTSTGLKVNTGLSFPTVQKVTDDYSDIVVHPDVAVTGNLGFSVAVATVVIRFVGGNGRVAEVGGTASATNGVFCPDGEPMYFTVTNANMHLYVPASTVAYVHGLKR